MLKLITGKASKIFIKIKDQIQNDQTLCINMQN